MLSLSLPAKTIYLLFIQRTTARFLKQHLEIRPADWGNNNTAIYAEKRVFQRTFLCVSDPDYPANTRLYLVINPFDLQHLQIIPQTL